MKRPKNHKFRYEEIKNGALILLLLKENDSWKSLCERFEYTDPDDLMNTTTMTLVNQLTEMKKLGLISFEEEETDNGIKPVDKILSTNLWPKIRVALGGMSLSELALISRNAEGVAMEPSFKRPAKPENHIHIFVLMPFDSEITLIYTNHLSKLGKEYGINIKRADEIFDAKPFMEKVWSGIFYSDLIIADCTQKNPNVFYEIGIAHTVGKRVILLTRSEDDIPADIRHFDYIPYVYNPEGIDDLVGKLKDFIKNHFGKDE